MVNIHTDKLTTTQHLWELCVWGNCFNFIIKDSIKTNPTVRIDLVCMEDPRDRILDKFACISRPNDSFHRFMISENSSSITFMGCVWDSASVLKRFQVKRNTVSFNIYPHKDMDRRRSNACLGYLEDQYLKVFLSVFRDDYFLT